MRFELRKRTVASLLVCLAVTVGCGGPVPTESETAQLQALGKCTDETEIAHLVSTLDATDRQALRQTHARFAALGKDERDRMRQLHESIVAHRSGGELYQVLTEYHDWLGTLPDGQRADLLELPTRQRVEKIQEIRQRQAADQFRVQAGDIPPQDAMAIARWVSDYIRNHHEELIRALPPSIGQRLRRMDSDRHRTRVLMMEIGRNARDIELPAPTTDELSALADALSPEAYRQLQKSVDFEDPRHAVRQLIRTVGRSMQRRGDRKVSKEQLMQFYNEDLSSGERDRLDALPAQDAQRELRRMYFFRKVMNEDGAGERPRGMRDRNELPFSQRRRENMRTSRPAAPPP